MLAYCCSCYFFPFSFWGFHTNYETIKRFSSSKYNAPDTFLLSLLLRHYILFRSSCVHSHKHTGPLTRLACTSKCTLFGMIKYELATPARTACQITQHCLNLPTHTRTHKFNRPLAIPHKYVMINAAWFGMLWKKRCSFPATFSKYSKCKAKVELLHVEVGDAVLSVFCFVFIVMYTPSTESHIIRFKRHENHAHFSFNGKYILAAYSSSSSSSNTNSALRLKMSVTRQCEV